MKERLEQYPRKMGRMRKLRFDYKEKELQRRKLEKRITSITEWETKFYKIGSFQRSEWEFREEFPIFSPVCICVRSWRRDGINYWTLEMHLVWRVFFSIKKGEMHIISIYFFNGMGRWVGYCENWFFANIVTWVAT